MYCHCGVNCYCSRAPLLLSDWRGPLCVDEELHYHGCVHICTLLQVYNSWIYGTFSHSGVCGSDPTSLVNFTSFPTLDLGTLSLPHQKTQTELVVFSIAVGLSLLMVGFPSWESPLGQHNTTTWNIVCGQF